MGEKQKRDISQAPKDPDAPPKIQHKKAVAEQSVSTGAEPTLSESGKMSEKCEKIFQSLDDGTKKLYTLLPKGVSFTPDSFVASGFTVGQVITSLTMLEIAGLVESLPGGVYRKK